MLALHGRVHRLAVKGFNSLFEMRAVELNKAFCTEPLGFNSLFEMRASQRGWALIAPVMRFNSLFEMPIERIRQYLDRLV